MYWLRHKRVAAAAIRPTRHATIAMAHEPFDGSYPLSLFRSCSLLLLFFFWPNARYFLLLLRTLHFITQTCDDPLFFHDTLARTQTCLWRRN
jgi:hypothetical protein